MEQAVRKMTGDAMLRDASSKDFSHPYEYLSSQAINLTLLKHFICFWIQASTGKDPLSLIVL